MRLRCRGSIQTCEYTSLIITITVMSQEMITRMLLYQNVS